VTYAPWHYRRLPLCEPSCAKHEPDVTMRSKALPYKRFGYSWRRAPPHAILGCYLVFLRLLERQPARMGLKAGSSTFSLSPGDAARPGLFSMTRIMPSIYHDREWQRNSVCQDPHTSCGLPPLTFRGDLEGFWRGKFLFYDFDHYRQILAGNMRGVYTGTFAEQAAEMEFKETLIKVRNEDVGGKGPMLCAGYEEDEEEGPEDEQKRIESGYGHQVFKDDDPDEEGWTKEILISGRVGLPSCAVLMPVSYELGLGSSKREDKVVGRFGHSGHRILSPHNGSMAMARVPTNRRTPYWPLARHLHRGEPTWVRRRFRYGSSRRYLLPITLPQANGRLARGRSFRCSWTFRWA